VRLLEECAESLKQRKEAENPGDSTDERDFKFHLLKLLLETLKDGSFAPDQDDQSVHSASHQSNLFVKKNQ